MPNSTSCSACRAWLVRRHWSAPDHWSLCFRGPMATATAIEPARRRACRSVHRFTIGPYGGLWLLPSADDEIAVASAVGQIWHVSPFLVREDSWLVLAVSRAPERTMTGFMDIVEGDERGAVVLDQWQRWL